MNELLTKIESKDLTWNNDLFYLGAALVTRVFENTKTKGKKKQPLWKDEQTVKLNSLIKIWGDYIHF